jgi:glycosyltransferase involved in cell wall biosynthesis
MTMISYGESSGVQAREAVRAPIAVAALGDVMDRNCFGGAPYQFFHEARDQGFAQQAWRVDVSRLRTPRFLWNAGRLLTGHKPGGFQFSGAGMAAALSQIPRASWDSQVISFHQHFPPFAPILKAGGEINFYFDATYAQLFPSYGLDRSLGRATLDEAMAYERDAFGAARRIIVNQSWALESLVADYGIDRSKCTVILPAANYPVFPGISPEPGGGRAGRDRPFVLGFIGKDWRRKGLLFLNDVANELRRAGPRVIVRAIGFPSDELPAGTGIEALGFIDKRTQFAPFLHGCDMGCLFSSAEAAGTAVLEFMGVGIPVAGFTVNGLADLLTSEAGFRFSADARPAEVAEVLKAYLDDEPKQARFRVEARRIAPSLLWKRCVEEFRELWDEGTVRAPFRLFRK